ncbi:MAG: response regulator [Pedobacter sp.]|nr:MAG: response regulator [Pedobacter sp.]
MQFSLQKPVLILCLSLLLVSFQSCNRKVEEKEFVIGFSQCVGSDLWRKTMLEEMRMELSLHPNIKFIYADANGNSSKQVAQVNELLNSNIDLLIVSANEAKPLSAAVDQAYQLQIPVVLLDRKTFDSPYTAYVGANNYEIGKMAAEYLATTVIKGQGTVIEITGLEGSSPAIERSNGFRDEIVKYPKVKVVKRISGGWLKHKAEAQLKASAINFNAIDAVFAHNDVMAAGARRVLDQLGLSDKVKIIGVDALPGDYAGLKLVEDKKITASVLYPTGGKESISTAFEILNGDHFAKETILKSVVIDSSNVQLMTLQGDRIRSQQKDIERQQVILENQLQVYNNQKLVLNIIIIALALVVVLGALAFHALINNRKINKKLNQKNAEILKQKNQLIEISEQVKEATEAKLNFFTNVSHEFRTPLALIISPLEDLLKNEKIKHSSGINLNLIHKNVYRLLRLVNQLIDYRKVEHKKLKVNASPVLINDFINELLESFRHIANKRDIELRVVSENQDMVVWFDQSLMEKVIFNLLSNALKFTSDNGKILIYINQHNSNAVIDVVDNGIGVNEKDIEHIFDHFYQGEGEQIGGSGIGLLLTREIIQLHHGQITVTSEKWKGTKFTVLLPLGDVHFTEDEKSSQPAQIQVKENVKIYTAEFEHELKPKPIDPLSPIHEHSILVVEDNPDMLGYLQQKFTSGYEIFTAKNGDSGLAQAYEKVPDLIISDVIMPGITGTELARRLKTDIRTSHIPIILLTAMGSMEQQIDGVHSMADLYITKPFSGDFLEASVSNLLKNRLMLKQRYASDVTATTSKKKVVNALDKKFLNDFTGLLEQNLGNERFCVEDICHAIGISRMQLYRKVKALLNCSIPDYILNRRLKKARYLIAEENLSIAETAHRVGISSATYFSTVFKAKYGITPSEFKKSQLNEI